MKLSRYTQERAQYQCPWFTSWIRKELGKRGILQEDFAEEMGLGWTTVRDYCTGVRSPSLKTFLMILDKLGLEIQITEKQ